MFRLDSKIAVIIGGAGGLGEAVALAFARQGAQVVIASRGVEKLQIVAKKIQADTNSEVAVMPVDVTDEDSVQRLASQVVNNFGTVDILVNAHGTTSKMAGTDIDVGKWDALFALNVRGTMLACKTFGKIMVANKKGKIINFSSVRGARGTDGGNTPYGATKGAVDMITRMLAAEWAAYKVNVNAVAPSIVLTEMLKKAVAPERLQMLISRSILGRVGTPEDVAAACVYLASAEADFVTGLILYIDGGLTAVG